MKLRGVSQVRARSMPMEEHEAVIKLVSRALETREEIVFAVVFGGFPGRPVFRDLDVGVYLGGFRGDAIDAAVYAEKLSVELTEQAGV
ncbi:MAG: hypothetical protein QXU62_01565, partial [Thermofilaceae archaeon]